MCPQQTAAAASLEQAMEQNLLIMRAFATGDNKPTKDFYSHRDDVTLVNPFGGIFHGWEEVSKALDYAVARFRDGEVTLEHIAVYESGDIAMTLDLEHWRVKFGGQQQTSEFSLRVSTTFRRELDGWRLAHRHADPLVTHSPDGPLRAR
jgi:ketosteroid isomerase-like protein